jgi:hypothetical protein
MHVVGETVQYVRSTAPRMAAALLLLLTPTEYNGTVAATFGGLTVQSDGTMGTAATPSPVLAKTVNVSATTETFLPKRRPRTALLFVTPAGGSFAQSFGGLTLVSASDAITPTPVESRTVLQVTRNIVAESVTMMAKRKPVTALLLSPLPLGGDVSASFGGLSLASDATLIDYLADLYLGGETRQEAYGQPQIQWPKRKQWHLLTTFNYPILTGDFAATFGGLSLSSSGSYTVPASADVSASLGGLTLSSQGALVVTADMASAIGGLALDSEASETVVITGQTQSAIGGLSLASSSSAPVAASATLEMGGISQLVSTQGVILGSGILDQTIGGLSLLAKSTQGATVVPAGRLVQVSHGSRTSRVTGGRVVIVDDKSRDT